MLCVSKLHSLLTLDYKTVCDVFCHVCADIQNTKLGLCLIATDVWVLSHDDVGSADEHNSDTHHSYWLHQQKPMAVMVVISSSSTVIT